MTIQRISHSDALVGLILSLAVCLTVAGFSVAITTASTGPAFAKLDSKPPTWLFGRTLVILFVATAIAAWLVWRQRGWDSAKWPLTLFGVQLTLNLVWSCLFFGLESPGLAFVEIIVLWVAIVATMVTFWLRSKIAGLLLVPYLAWVSFAAALNFTVWRLCRAALENRQARGASKSTRVS